MKLIPILLTILFISHSAGADPIVCDTVLESGSTPAVDGVVKITLRSNTFWDTAPGHHLYMHDSIRSKIQDLISDMPAELRRSSGLTSRERAQQLQWALHVANGLTETGAVPKNAVELTLNPCYYDFSDVAAHQDTGTADPELARLLPKLVLLRDNLTILGLAHPATIGYEGPSTRSTCTASGRRCHGRVLMLVPRGLEGIKLLRLTFQGDHDASQFFVPEQYLHENHGNLTRDWARYGMLMIGYGPPGVKGINKIVVSGCVFKNVNFRAIELSGNATIQGNRFEGVLPPPTGAPTQDYLNALSCFSNPNQSFCPAPASSDNLYSVSGNKPFGMNWHSAISFRDYVVTTFPTLIESNTIQDFVEGVVGGSLPDGSTVRLNTVRRIADHGFYALGTVKEAHIDSNVFERILGASIKIGGDGKRTCPADESLAQGGLASFKSSLSSNRFRLIGASAILMAGSFNQIEGNLHDPIRDATGWFNLDLFPFIWITTYGGNTSPDVCGYHNHSAYNMIKDNQSARPDIFIQQFEDPLWCKCLDGANAELKGDRSIEGNRVDGGGQIVYVQARGATAYHAQSNVEVFNGSTKSPDPFPCYGSICRDRNRLVSSGEPLCPPQ